MRLYANADRSRFFLLPDAAALARGELKLTAMTGESFSVDGAAAARFEVPEAVAKAFAEHAAAGMASELTDMQIKLAETLGVARAQLNAIGKNAGLGGNPQEMLRKLGVDPTMEPEAALRALAAMTLDLSSELPKFIAGTLDAQATLGKLDATLGGAGSDPIAALLETVAAPGTSPELQEAARKIAEMQKKLREEA